MKIIKFKKLLHDKYQLILENNETIEIYMDLILKENLLLTKEIDDLEHLLDLNRKYVIYDDAITYLKHKLRSIFEIRNYLLKREYDINSINEVIDRLITERYLNDELYSKCYIEDRLHLSLDGPVKISRYLEDMEINPAIYEKYLAIFDQETINQRINKYLTKQLKSNKKSNYLFKNKMLINLVNLGYDKEDILANLNTLSLPSQGSLKEQEEAKLFKKLSRKYSGEELKRKVREKLYQKGFFE